MAAGLTGLLTAQNSCRLASPYPPHLLAILSQPAARKRPEIPLQPQTDHMLLLTSDARAFAKVPLNCRAWHVDLRLFARRTAPATEIIALRLVILESWGPKFVGSSLLTQIITEHRPQFPGAGLSFFVFKW